MLHAAARYMIRSVVLLALLAGIVGGGWLAVDRLIIKADGPHDSAVLVRIAPGGRCVAAQRPKASPQCTHRAGLETLR